MSYRAAIVEAGKELGPQMNADEHGLTTKILSAFIGVHLRLVTAS
jgi:hypothetical protein